VSSLFRVPDACTTYRYLDEGQDGITASASRASRTRTAKAVSASSRIFFNVSGMGTPEFREAQRGFQARLERWNDISRGHHKWVEGHVCNGLG